MVFRNALLFNFSQYHSAIASSIVSGSFLPRVSGRKTKTRIPPISAPLPIMIRGRGTQTEEEVAMKGAMIPPILPHRELAPTAELLDKVKLS